MTIRTIPYKITLLLLLLILQAGALIATEKVVTIISPSGAWTQPIVEELSREVKNTSPDSHIELHRLSPTGGEASPKWRDEMLAIVEKIEKHELQQQLIVLVGDEAWTLFYELDGGRSKATPLLLCGVKRYSISYDAMYNLDKVNGDSLVLTRDKMQLYPKSELVCEPIAEYMEKSVEMILKQLPETKQIALVTSSVFYGVYTRTIAEMVFNERFPHLTVNYFDGRTLSTEQLNSRMNELPQQSVLLLGSWYTQREEALLKPTFWTGEGIAKRTTPIFMLSNIWSAAPVSVGGYYAANGVVGAISSSVLRRMLRNEGTEEELMSSLAQWSLNWKLVDEFKINKGLFRSDRTIYYNIPEHWLYRYHKELLYSAILLLLLMLFLGYKNWMHSHYNNRLSQQNQMLEESNRLRSAFLKNISHEVKTPLNALQGFSSLMSDQTIDNDERVMCAKMVHDNALKLARMFDEVMEISKIETGSFNLNIRELDLSAILLMSSQCRSEYDAAVNITLPKVELSFRGDEERILQVLEELIGNAIKHSDCSEKSNCCTNCVEIAATASESTLLFSVKDGGRGIAKENQKLIFERFFKVNDHERGSGLGLSKCKLLVERMGGEIWVDSTLGEGATFFFTLPR